jgi:hypothetical protein
MSLRNVKIIFYSPIASKIQLINAEYWMINLK